MELQNNLLCGNANRTRPSISHQGHGVQMTKIPFHRRIQQNQDKPIVDDFPESARVALAYFFKELVKKECIASWSEILDELGRIGRLTLSFDQSLSEFDMLVELLRRVEWMRIYTFCERAYDRLLSSVEEWVSGDYIESFLTTVMELTEVREFYTNELNFLLLEENLGFQFQNGTFFRRGRPQTQKAIQKVNTVLSDPRLTNVRNHFNKALKFFNQRPEPDHENCIKEALCSLEACLHTLIPNATQDFVNDFRRIQGNRPRQVPSPIVESMIKLFGYRGGAQGVAHAAIKGNRVSEFEAELIMSTVASYVTYLTDVLSVPDEEVPF